ncbi:MAG: tetratricopeptide repeat protein [Candidatus Omnitrophica bacterium]|nr:tetratricopeptide repeat protein [Candidatus Omnitrophota bacterium]
MEEIHVKLYLKGKELVKLKRYDEAIACFNEAIELNPGYKEAYNERGNAFLIMGKADDALGSFNIATEIDPKYVDGWRNKEAVYLLLGNYEEVIKCSDCILKINPYGESVWINRGCMMMNLQRFNEAVECFDKVLEINPGSRYAMGQKKSALSHLVNTHAREIRRLTKKICLLGNPAVGKTSLIRRYVYDVFDDKYITTIGTKITKKVLSLKYRPPRPDIILTLIIWDMAGQEELENLRSAYYQGSDGGIFVCDTTRKETLYNLNSWVNTFFKITEKVPIVFFGNKIDLSIQASFGDEELGYIAKVAGAQHYLTSAKTGRNVEEAFSVLGRMILEQS